MPRTSDEKEADGDSIYVTFESLRETGVRKQVLIIPIFGYFHWKPEVHSPCKLRLDLGRRRDESNAAGVVVQGAVLYIFFLCASALSETLMKSIPDDRFQDCFYCYS